MTLKMRSNDLILIGDTHSITRLRAILADENFPRDCAVLHLGDCGIGFTPRKDKKRLAKVNKIAEEKNIVVYIGRGNHDDPSYWDGTFYGEKVTLVPDYSTLIFPNGKRGIWVGGGISIDREHRILNESYWKDEPTPFFPEYCVRCDYAFFHDAPSYFNKPNKSIYNTKGDPLLSKDCMDQRKVIDRIVDLVKPKKIYGGHFHQTISENVNGIQYRGLDIDECLQFFA